MSTHKSSYVTQPVSDRFFFVAFQQPITTMPPKKKATGSLGENLYEGAAGYGRFRVYVSAALGALVGLGLLGGGVYLSRQPSVQMAQTKGTILSSQCRTVVENKNFKIKCANTVQYRVNGQSYQRIILTNGDREYKKGDIIDLEYELAHPQNARAPRLLTARTAGMLMLGAGVLVIGFSLIKVFMARKFKFFAASEAVSPLLARR